jgi:hypothetical protein
MHTLAAPAPTDQIFFTALPNGISGKQLCLSLLITPSLVTTPLGDPFRDWPTYIRNQKLKWSATFADPNSHAALGPAVSLTLDPNSLTPDRDKSLWREIFDGTSCAIPRTAHKKIHRSWRVSHDITNLHNRHELYRLSHAYSQASASRNAASPDLVAVQQQTGPPPLFLHPDFNTGTASDLPLRIDDRAKAATTLDQITTTLPTSTKPHLNFQSIVQNRFKYAVNNLEKYGGARLSAASLCAAYIFSLNTATPAGKPDPTLTAAVTQISGWFTTGSNFFVASYPEFPFIPDYLTMLLFHRRSTTKKISDPITQPDFHQLLGMVHNYPAIMRQLNLVYDFVLTPPAGISGLSAVSINLSPPPVGNLLPGTPTPITVVSCYTRCTVMSDRFFATPTPPNAALIKDGVLNLQAPGANSARRFTLVPENADSQALKLTDQFNNAARGTQYSTSAPTALNSPSPYSQTPGKPVPTPSANANPSTAPPAPRTVGLALFDRDRLAGLEQQAANIPDGDSPPTAPAKDFFAEDLILGYRVDVLYKQKFYSLCTRNSNYDIYIPRTTANANNKVDWWKPATAMEISADEGFTSFGATQSPMSDQGSVSDPTATQTQVHQAMFTWIGWSLSVPAPEFPQMNPPKTVSEDPSSNHLAIRPTYTVLAGQLPPLRFNTDYKVRCRLVDLAGNGPLPTLDPSNAIYDDLTAQPFTQFSRHEPIRAPQFLLHEPIDRIKNPGTHIDRMVARDNDSPSSRMLVPPRESLRLAELSGYLTNDKLPGTAFAYQRLETDGAFPTVARAKDQHWVPGKADNPNDNDPIFLPSDYLQNPSNRYYPDPLANFVRFDVFVLTDNPAVCTPLDSAWLKISERGVPWPQRLAVRVRLIPTDKNIDPKMDVDQRAPADEDFGPMVMPTLSITLPRATTVVMRISSAAVDSGGNSPDGRDYSVHLTHLVDRHKKNPAALDAFLPRSQRSQVRKSVGQMLQTFATSLSRDPNSPFNSPHAFVDGSLPISTPHRLMTLVHAVQKPLAPPAFSFEGLQITRDPGKPEAHVAGQLGAHWLSTGKITCYAEWSDRVDDLNLPGERKQPNPHREVAFTITSKELPPDALYGPTRLRYLDPKLLHHFTDTRAHDVTYTLVASTNFREYYPEAKTEPDPHAKLYQIDGKGSLNVTVASSARPLAPSIVYVIPAFVWVDTYDSVNRIWYSGRTVVLRVYFERPFLLSGDRETVAAVLFDPHSATPPIGQNFVSRWGADPTREITSPILHNELSEANFCEPGPPIETCILAEGGTARFKPCAIQYSDERRLWFTDIPINIQHANAPFVRLALVRWQPDALSGDSEARCSQVVLAEFMQVSADRWVSLKKISGSKYTVTVSGAFPSKNPQPCLTLTLYKRWYALGRDSGWRKVSWPVDHPINFVYAPPTDDSSISSWSTDMQTPHSAYVAKYRVLLTEEEFPGQETRKSLSMFIDLP